MSERLEDRFRSIVEVVLLAAEGPVALDDLTALFAAESELGGQALRDEVRRVLGELAAGCAERGVELREVAGGFRYQVRDEYARWVARFLGERPARYSRALFETLALIAYRQPITRGEIEDVRGVGVGTSIMRTLHEREWIRVLSHREVPGRPALYGTTRKFLDDFGLRSVEELPPLDRIRDVTPADLFPAGGVGADDANGTQTPGFPPGFSGGDGSGEGARGEASRDPVSGEAPGGGDEEEAGRRRSEIRTERPGAGPNGRAPPRGSAPGGRSTAESASRRQAAEGTTRGEEHEESDGPDLS